MDQAQLILYYENARKHYAKYHDYKEKSAWGGLLFYVLFCGTVFQYSPPAGPLNASYELGVLGAIVVVGFLIYLYIHNQLRLKDMGGAYVAAALWLVAEIGQQPATGFDVIPYLKIEKGGNSQFQSSHCLPDRFRGEAERFNLLGRGAQDTTRVVLIGLFVVSSIMALFPHVVSIILNCK